MYGGSNELFGRNQNFPLFLNIKLHLKMPVNFNFLNILSFLGGSVPPLRCVIVHGFKQFNVKLNLYITRKASRLVSSQLKLPVHYTTLHHDRTNYSEDR